MPSMLSFAKTCAVIVALALTLAGCKSADEKAEEYYQSGLALVEAGDYERAILEFRNVFQLDFSHQEARRTLARVLRDNIGDPARAYRQYLRLAEQYPDDLEARIALSEIAFMATNWEELERHGQVAEELDPENPQVQVISVVRAYRTAALDDDQAEMRAQTRRAADLLMQQPENTLLRNILFDADARAGNLQEARAGIEWLLERDPDNQTYLRQRLGLLIQLDDMAAVETQLLDMVEKFPERSENKQALIRFYMSRGQTDEVETFLRQLAAEAAADDPGPTTDLLQFLRQVRGVEAMRVELDNAIQTQADPIPFHVMRAALDYEDGDRGGAIATLETLLDAAEPSDNSRNAKVALARMLLSTGNEVGARARIAEVLAGQANHPEALKMDAAWQIQGDQTDLAVANLRTVLDSNPDDAQAMTLMSQAYARAGRPELARDFLSLAVEASNNAPAESLRYARLLMSEERYLPAEDALLPALRLEPNNLDLLATLGELYIAMEDEGRLLQVVRTLRQLENPRAKQLATGLETARINMQSGSEDAVRYLESLASGADATLSSRIALIRARLVTNDVSGALELARKLRDDAPGSPEARSVLASVEMVSGNLDAAESLFRDLLDEDNTRSQIWVELIRLKGRQGDPESANALLEQALAVLPDDITLLWARASFDERDGNIDGAIAIYEKLYARNSSLLIVANNLASLLSTYKDDAESLERAWIVARRFRETTNPAMQDTYGWIAHRRGDSEEALPYLENAAAGLPNDPLVQFHLGQVYQKLDRAEEAIRRYRRAVELAGPADQRDQIKQARALIAESQNGQNNESDN